MSAPTRAILVDGGAERAATISSRCSVCSTAAGTLPMLISASAAQSQAVIEPVGRKPPSAVSTAS